MRPVDLELLVQQAVERRRAGRQVEDDRVEFKSDWPGPDKGRQFAGAANALRGEELIYVIGVDDDGQLTAASKTEPADWYDSFCKHFDSPPPRLVLNRVVAVGDAPDDSVTAVVFETDEFPYVMKVLTVTDRREVPIRVGTGTKSANRHQLMRILAPTIFSPPCFISEFEATTRRSQYEAIELPAIPGDTSGTHRRPARDELHVFATGRVFVEFTGSRAVSIPTRTVKGSLIIDGHEMGLDLDINELEAAFSRVGSPSSPEPIPPAYGVHAKHRMIVATGPGEFSFRTYLTITTETLDVREFEVLAARFADAETLEVRLTWQFVGTESTTAVSAELVRTVGERQSLPHDVELGKWLLENPM